MLINFDFDGVIADSFGQLLALCIGAQKVTGLGRMPVDDDLRRLENLTFEGLADRLEIPSMMVPDFLKTVFEHQQKDQSAVHFFPGMDTLLKDLSRTSDIGIITSSSSDLVRGYLVEYGVAESVSFLCGGEKGRSKKESILDNMDRLSVSPQQTCMVGDAISDIRQGKAAGVMTVAVGWGFQEVELLRRENPDYLAGSPGELLKILKSQGY